MAVTKQSLGLARFRGLGAPWSTASHDNGATLTKGEVALGTVSFKGEGRREGEG